MTKKTKIRTINELPEWFDLSRYDELSTYTNEELKYDLKRRHRIYHNDFYSLDSKKEKFRDIEKNPLKSQSYARAEKFSLTVREKTEHIHSDSKEVEHKKPDSERNKQIDILADMSDNSPLMATGSSLVGAAKFVDVSSAVEADYNQRGYELDPDLTWLVRYDDLMKGPFNKSKAILRVNFNATDKQLKDAFANLIPIYRKHLAIPQPQKKVTDIKIRDVKNLPVIPYIDLMLWADLYGFEIIDSVYASVFYPDGRYDGDKIRQCIEPSALAVLEPQFLGALNERALQERKSKREKV